MQGDTLLRLERALQLGQNASSSDYDLNLGLGPNPKAATRDASVLVLFQYWDDTWHVILTKRASALRHHPGQIAFPGGKVDEGDASAEAAALREAHEEIGLEPHKVDVLGQLGPHHTVTQFNVTPVVGVLNTSFTPKIDPSEVDAVFRVPLTHLMDPAAIRVEARVWQGNLRKYYVIPYGPFYIWGATARMIEGLRRLWDQAA